ncbi:MAG TPA: hypothetical protein VGR46_10450 [Candidatus Limnocylindria bacterium]|nr:hypothetical protein [Candidatus Limnocylindria bacterium]
MDPRDYEKLGQFYLGREYDLEKKSSAGGNLVLYDSKDLVTHAIVVGMTGSGKTGLCIDLIEEAAIDGVPTIAIDPKGDLTNLLLTFPDLRPEDFRPWINEEDAARKGVTPDEYAKQQAELWRKGLESWGESGERIRRLRDAADFAIYTPGSTAGIPVSILRSFAAPPAQLREDTELFRERVSTTATSLLALVGIAADPIKSREHILISTLLSAAWAEGEDVELATLVGRIQKPPMARIGALDLEKFYPEKDRGELAMRINGLLASPGFGGWLEGEPLDVGALYRTPAGKPRVSIFSIAHLSEAERMFFVALLLNEILGWVRSQSGTTSLRAILYMDEIFGFFPPVAEPPAKRPLLTLLKQARAFGVGVVLATQNPVDLDYKGLANTGTWLLGRLQTDRDKQRVLEGLEGAAAAQSASFDRKSMEELLAGLANRVFLMNNVHEDGPVVLESRWAMSYLRGPLTRDQIKVLMKGRQPQAAAAPAAQATRAARADEDQHTREERDAAIEAIRTQYAPKIHRAEEKARRAAQIVEREEGQLRGAGLQTAVSAGATILTAIFGRKKLSYSTIDRGTTTARGAARAMEQREDVKRAKENLAQAEQEIDDLKAEVEEKVAGIRAG